MSGGSTQVAAYAYDAVGNLTRKKEGQLDLTLDYDQTGQPQPHPHAVTKLKFTGTANTYKALSYDTNGSLAAASATAGGAQQDGFAFDAENRLKTRSSGLSPASVTTEYVYDGSGALVKKTTTPAPGAASAEKVVYLSDGFEKNVTTGVVTKYYAASGHAVAMRKGTGGQVLYILADHLGSTGAIVDPATDTVLASRKYWPYGGERAISGDARVTSHWYTGQRDEDFDGLGLYNYNARFYSTIAGRFLSVDPVAGSGDPQSWNPYSYVRGNPLRFTDPTGLDAASDWAGSGSIGKERDTGCSYECQQLQALAGVGWSLGQWQAWQLMGALLYIQRENELAAAWASAAPATPALSTYSSLSCPSPQACSAVLALGESAFPIPAAGAGAAGSVEWGAAGLALLRLGLEVAPRATLVGMIAATAFISDAPTHQRPIVIGETAPRVKRAAARLGAEFYPVNPDDLPKHPGPNVEGELAWRLNERWIRTAMAENRVIFDIQQEPGRTDRGIFYERESALVGGYWGRVRLNPYDYP